MVTATLTIDGMAKKKQPKGAKPQNRSPAYTIFARVPPELGEAFEAYLDSLEPRPKATGAVALAIREFLSRRGFWPPTSTQQEGE